MWPERFEMNNTRAWTGAFSAVQLCPEKRRSEEPNLGLSRPKYPDTGRSIAQPVQEHARGQGILPHIFLALFTTRFIDLSQVSNISNGVGAELWEKVLLFLQCAAEPAHSGGVGTARGLDTVSQPFRPSICPTEGHRIMQVCLVH